MIDLIICGEGEEEDDEGDEDSEESAEEEKILEGTIDVEKYEYQIGAHMRMKNALAAERDILERNRYIEKIRSAQTIKIICDPEELNALYGQMFQNELTHRVLEEMGSDEDAYYGTIIQYINQYLYNVTEVIPEEDSEVWAAFHEHPKEYITAIKIRDVARSIGKDFKKHFLIGDKEQTNYATIDYIRKRPC